MVMNLLVKFWYILILGQIKLYYDSPPGPKLPHRIFRDAHSYTPVGLHFADLIYVKESQVVPCTLRNSRTVSSPTSMPRKPLKTSDRSYKHPAQVMVFGNDATI